MKLAITIKGSVEIEPHEVDAVRQAFIDGPEEVMESSYAQMTEKIAKELDLDPSDVTISLDIVEEEEDV